MQECLLSGNTQCVGVLGITSRPEHALEWFEKRLRKMGTHRCAQSICICGCHTREPAYLLKFIRNSQISTCGAFAVFRRHGQSDETLSCLMNTLPAEVEQDDACRLVPALIL